MAFQKHHEVLKIFQAKNLVKFYSKSRSKLVSFIEKKSIRTVT